MAKHLSDRDIEKVVELLDGWRGDLNWEALCNACGPVIGTVPARQTLYRVTRIKNAFQLTKERLKRERDDGEKLPSSMRVAADRITRLERENERLTQENSQLLEQFVVWQYNAYTRGLTDKDLNRPLPSIDRGRS